MPTRGIDLNYAIPYLDSRGIVVDEGKIRAFAVDILPGQLQLPAWRDPVFPVSDDEQTVKFFFIANSVNFCFWGSPKWKVRYKGREYDGSFGLFAAFSRAIDERIPILDAGYLAELQEEQLARIFRANIQIPLLAERLVILREIGRVLAARYGGSVLDLLKSAEGRADMLVSRITEVFPSFRDTASFGTHRVDFNKRAQLVAGMLFARFRGKSYGELKGFDTFTLFADYKIPQVLRYLEILRYDPTLAGMVDNMTELTPTQGDTIRLATICAGAVLMDHLRKRFPQANAVDLDGLLWQRSQERTVTMLPYHRVKSIFY